MSRRQVMRRMGMRATRRPRTSKTVKVPKRYEEQSAGPIIAEKKLRGIGAREAFKAWKKADGNARFRLSVHSSGSISAEQLASQLADWRREEWVPDVVVVDYVDLLAPPKGIRDRREQIDETWKQLRRLSQEGHCCVVTATQADAKSYDAKLVGARNFSESRTKNDHVTAGIGLNVNEDDREKGVVRLNWLKRRDDAYVETRQVYVAGCLAIGCPAIVSCV